MEYVRVRCSDGAKLMVSIDGVQSGRTGLVLGVQRGTHTFTLCRCPEEEHCADCHADRYRPVSQKTAVEDTVRIDPLEVLFERLEG